MNKGRLAGEIGEVGVSVNERKRGGKVSRDSEQQTRR